MYEYLCSPKPGKLCALKIRFGPELRHVYDAVIRKCTVTYRTNSMEQGPS
jgi:hypothetical protein